MNLSEELTQIKRHFLVWILLLLTVTVISCSIKFTFPEINTTKDGPGQYVDKNEEKTIVAYFFTKAKEDLLPRNAELISTSPITVFLVQIKIGLLASFVILLPYLFYSFVSYLSPALFPREKRRLVLIVLFSSALFVSGIVFSYLFLVKSMFGLLLSFNDDFSVQSFLPVDEFISWSLAALFMTGILFLLPVFMYSLTSFKIIKTRFWTTRWREAFILFLIISSVITPDVSGVSVVILSLPMSLLYLLGITLSALSERNGLPRRVSR